MEPNKPLLVGGLIIITFGALNAAINNKPETPVFAGGIGVVLIASLLDAFGGPLRGVANGLVGLAVLTVLLVEGPSVISAIQNKQGTKKQ